MASNEGTHLVCIMKGIRLYVVHMQWECRRSNRDSVNVTTRICNAFPLCNGGNQDCVSRRDPQSCRPLALRGLIFSPTITALCLCSQSLVKPCQVQEARLDLAIYLPLCRALPSPSFLGHSLQCLFRSPEHLCQTKARTKSLPASAARAPAVCVWG